MLSDVHNPVLYTAGEVVYPFYYAGFLYLVLSFPSGQLRGRLDRALVVVTIGLVVVVNPAVLLFADSQMLCGPARRTCWKWPAWTRS
jgi:predicted PurR-regulated permease PerM